MKNLMINRAQNGQRRTFFSLWAKKVESLILFCCFLSATRMFAYDATVDGLYYNLNSTDHTATVTYQSYGITDSYNKNWDIQTANIPSSITVSGKTYTVTSIGENAFRHCTGLTSVTIPNSVTSIGEVAFDECSSLTSIEIPNSVTSIGWNAFADCTSLTFVTINSNAIMAGSYLGNIFGLLVAVYIIGNEVTSIGASAFSGCTGMSSVTIGNNVTSIGNSAFSGCTGLTFVTINSNEIMSKPAYSMKTIFGDQVETFIIGNEVTSIGSSAFNNCSSLRSVTIPNGVTSIGDYAFKGCSGLTSIEIPNSVTSIGKSAFKDCSGLTSVTISNSVTSIEDDTFLDCTGLTSVSIPNSVTSIGLNAFAGCTGLTSVSIPNSVTSMEEFVFQSCTGLKSVSINSDAILSQNYSIIGKSMKTIFGNQVETYIIGNEVTSIGDCAFYKCSGLTSIEIPNSVTSIGKSAFEDCSGLTSVTIPNSVISIGNHAFYGCAGLTSVTIPNSVTSIENYTFSGCTGLTSVTIGDSVTSIGNNAFRGCGNITSVVWNAKNCNGYNLGSQVTSFTFGNEVEIIPDSICLGMNKLTSITIPNSVTSIGKEAFKDCSGLTSIEIPNSVTSIGGSAFKGCSGLTSVTIPNSVTSIGNNAFSGCGNITSVVWNAKNCNGYNFGNQVTSYTFGNEVEIIPDSICLGMNKLTSITIPNSVTSIGKEAFKGCSGLTSIEIPYGVTSIEDFTCSGCTGLTSVTIPNSVTSIGSRAFYECSGLESVTIPNSIKSIREKAFEGCSGLTFVTINSNDIMSKQYNSNYSIMNIFGKQVETYILGNEVTSIGDYAFKGCSGLSTVKIPNSVTSIGWSAFRDCSSLRLVTIPNSVTSIGDYAFSGCIGLASFEIPNGVTSIRSYVFYGCYDLKSVGIPNSVTSIGSYAFYGCSGLKSIAIPNSITSIGVGAFYGCSGLASIEIPNGVTSIEKEVFKGCSGLSSIEIPNSATSIRDDAFSGCGYIISVVWNAKNCNSYNFGSQVESFVFGEEVEAIPNGLCSGMTKLTSIIIPNSVTSIGVSAFKGCRGLRSVTIPNSVTSIGENAFNDCSSLKLVTIGNSVTSIGENAFTGCKNITSVVWNAKNCNSYNFGSQVESFVFGEEVETIPDGLCAGMTKLTSIIIPNSVTSIGENAFSSCTGLTSITCNAITPPTISNSVFEGLNCSNILLFVPNESVLQYRNAEGWKKFNIRPLETKMVTVQVSVTNGTVEGEGEYEIYSNVVLKVIPNEGYSFKQWADGNVSNPRTIYVTQDTVLNAICEPVPAKSLPYNEPFSSNIGSFTIKDVKLGGVDYVWKWASAEYGMKASAYMNNTNHATESWLISPAISLPGDQDITLYFEHAVNKGTPDNLRVKISTNFGTSWNDLSVPNWPGGTSWIFVPTSVSLNAYADKNIQIAFVYKSTSSDCPTWEIKNFSITGIVNQPTYVKVQASATNGRVEGAGEYEINSNVVLKVIPNEGYSFKQWADGNVSNPRTIYVTQDTVLNAICEAIPDQPTYVTVQASATNGRVEGAGEYKINSNVVLKVIPNEGYSFKQWTDGDVSNPRTIYVTQDTVLNAICEAISANSLPYNESFSSNIGSFTIEDVDLGGLDYVWKWANANYGMKASAYVNNTNHATESWLISPTLSLQKVTDIVLAFEHAVNKGTPKNLRVKISADSGTSWNDLNVPNWPEGTSWNFVSTSVSLDAYADKIVQVAFVYKSTSSDCPTWEIKNFSITGTVNENEDVEIISEESKNSSTRKILHDGQVFIQRGDKLYTLQGQEVK